MAADDYLEWQISYDTDDLHDPSIVSGVVLQKESGVRYGCELVRLIVEARARALVPAASWAELRKTIDQRLNVLGIEEGEHVAVGRASQDPVFETQHGFQRFVHHVPDYLKCGLGYAVEIKIAPKQRAVGTQAMIYFIFRSKFVGLRRVRLSDARLRRARKLRMKSRCRMRAW